MVRATLKSCQLVIFGEVQGVGLRVKVREEARRRQLQGWIKNLPDGSVECLVCGTSDKLEKFLGWLRQDLSPAVVRAINYKYRPVAGQFNDFVIVYD